MNGVKRYYVYILTNNTRTLYVGITSDLARRILEHREMRIPGFTARYKITQLICYEEYATAWQAIEREKQIKGWTRAKKIALIEKVNPHWEDLG